MKPRLPWFALVVALAWLVSVAHAQRRPYIGYTYPAGGQQATTFQIKLGGQDLDDVHAVTVTGGGVSAKVVDYFRRLNNQEIQLLNEQLKALKRPASTPNATESGEDEATRTLRAKIEQRTREWVQTPACVSISSLVVVEVKIAPDAELGSRELRLVTSRGSSNPLVFQVGQLREYARNPMLTATLQILGKEAASLRKRPAAEAEDRVALPCTLNGQVASGEENRYRFTASKGQRLALTTQARQLIPFVADAVPGWFQPVLVLYDAKGHELAYADDDRFKPDPVILFEVPADGDYVVAIYDAIYRGREDFVYRLTIGELPFLTGLFPLGASAGVAAPPSPQGWNIADADLVSLPDESANSGSTLGAVRLGYQSNVLPFERDSLPDIAEQEPNNTVATAQKVSLPIVVNGRINRPDDWDVYEFTGRANQTIVAEVHARRLESPLDSVITLTDANGKLIASNDDREDLAAGANTHAADSYLLTRLPADGNYFIHIGDTARNGGEEYGYRLRISEPRPDFELRVVPSSVSLPVNSSGNVTVYAIRRDGFTGPITLSLNDPPAGLSAPKVVLPGNQNIARLALKGSATPTKNPVNVSIVGVAKCGEQERSHGAVPAEDRMQAFLWRHLVPASELQVTVYDPKYQPPPTHPAPVRPAPKVGVTAADVSPAAAAAPGARPSVAPKFNKQQIAGRLRQLKLLYEDGLLTDAFYEEKVAECDSAL